MKRTVILLAFCTLLLSPKSTPAQDFTFHAFVSAAYSYNLNTPESTKNQLRVFDFDDNSFKLDVAELVVEKAVPNPGDIGFRIDFVAGASIPRVIASSGLFRDPDTGEAEDFDLEQGYVSVNAARIHLDFGKFITHAGAEVIEGYDGFNDNYSRSLLFGFAIPFTHTGLRASYAINDRVSILGMVVNGWDNVKDNNRGKTVGGQLTVVPFRTVTAYLNYLGGPEQNDSDNFRHLLDVVMIWKPTERVAVTFNYDHATDKNGVGPGQNATWHGFALYGKIGLTDSFSITVRGERFEDEDGVRTGTPQNLREVTFTPEVRVRKNFVVRGDLRFDHSDKKVFESDETFKQNQTTIALNLLYFF